MSIQGLLGRKVGMTTHYREDGTVVPVTVIRIGPCIATQIRTRTRDGYEAVQVGFEPVKRLNKPETGHQARSGGKFRFIHEFRPRAELASIQVGQKFDASVFQVGDFVAVTGTSKGRGYQGGMRRHNFKGGPRTHGQSDRQRSPGAIGSTTHPGHVWKGTRMAGHMGAIQATISGIQIVKIDPEQNVVLVKGAVPGPENGLVTVRYLGRESAEHIARREAERKRQAEAAKKPETIQKAPRAAPARPPAQAAKKG
ncbi:MAG: 50S ribosomal protein L3 [Chloroflexi bacterium]|nr:50S ribosomal protein L3 [Chloroflexota bacterium]